MSKSRNVVAALIAVAALGLGVGGVYAHPGQAAGGMGPHMKGGPQHRGSAGGHGGAAGHQLLTPEERTELQQKMRAATTSEERQKLAQATRTEIQKRAAEKGITLPGPDAAARGRFNHTHWTEWAGKPARLVRAAGRLSALLSCARHTVRYEKTLRGWVAPA